MNPAHVDYEVLADLAEGLLEDDQAASVNAHLETCADCRDRSADLADVSRILAEAPVPSMPAELAERIDTALAEESLNNATVVSLEQRRGRRHWRILSAAAATVVVLGGAGLVGGITLDEMNGDHGQASTPAHDPADASGEEGASGAPPPGQGSSPGSQIMGGSAFSVVHSGTGYRAGTLTAQVDGLAGRAGKLPAAPPGGRLADCVQGVTGGRAPDLVDQAEYEGRQATVIALRGEGTGGWNIWVVGPECSARNQHLLKRVGG
ncbi:MULTISPECIES: anti-sigma factor family protein [Actinomadura]|uniref:anti-sigma factor family protein n=1 Tax=Actinomadura TaxID=1988 RepID=UPI000F781955|nr:MULTISPECIES: zf-HC2 domain-containing protein [Actinomadura]